MADIGKLLNIDDPMLRIAQTEIPQEFPKEIAGIPHREKLFPGEDEFFKNNPDVTGMAAEDNHIILNPYSSLSNEQKNQVMINEAARIFMRQGKIPLPTFNLTPEQQKTFSDYSSDSNDVRQTIVGRILSGDKSAGNITEEQLQYVQQLRKLMGIQ